MIKYTKLSNQNRQYLLLGLLILVLGIGGVWLKYYRQYGPEPLYSSADEQLLHWPHSEIPAKITLVNTAPFFWNRHIAGVAKIWGTDGYVQLGEVKQSGLPGPCPFEPGVMKFCPYNDPEDPYLGYAGFGYDEEGHIGDALFGFNDYWLNNPETPFGTVEFRNYITCYSVGFMLGVPSRDIPAKRSNSCMNINYDFGYVQNQQEPDKEDLEDLKVRYKHIDKSSLGMPIDKTVEMSKYLDKKNFGRLVELSIDGQREVYKQDLGDGYTMMSVRFKKPTNVNNPEVK